MVTKITVREWVNNFKNGMYDDPSRKTQIKAGWYDWFCNDSSLQKKTEKIGKILCKLTNDYLLDNYYVCFKNNWPFGYPYYDDFRFVPLREEPDDKRYFVVSINERDWRESGKYKIYTARNNFEMESNAKSTKELLEKLNDLGNQLANK